MPYAHKYANAVTDYGMLGALMHFMPDGRACSETMISRRQGTGAPRTSQGWRRLLIDAEMKMFAGA